MKIVVINGTVHHGSTYNVGIMLANKLKDGDSIKEFLMPRDLNHFCLGCFACVEDETKCPYYSEKKVIVDAMEEADLFIFTTPNYCLAPTAAMKSFLDMMFDVWMVHRPKEWMFNKKAVVIATSAGASCKEAIKPIKTSLQYWGVSYIKTFGIPVHANSFKNISEKTKEKIEKATTRLAKELKGNKNPRVSIKTKAIFNMMGFLHKKGWDSSPCEKEYWEQRGWLKKERPWKHH